MLSQEFTKKLGEAVVRPQLDGLMTVIPLDRRPKVSNEPRGDLIRWFWNGPLYTDDCLSVRVSLGCQGDSVVRAKVRAYYDKAFASKATDAPSRRDRQEVYSGKTRKFMADDAGHATFSDWLKNELHKCTTVLRRHT
jgi:hypothetical protein